MEELNSFSLCVLKDSMETYWSAQAESSEWTHGFSPSVLRQRLGSDKVSSVSCVPRFIIMLTLLQEVEVYSVIGKSATDIYWE